MEMNRSAFIWGTICGLFLSIVLGACIAVVAAKAGISPAISPLVVLIGWMSFFSFFPKNMTDFLSALQVTGSGGSAIAAGVVFSAPIAQVLTKSLYGEAVDVNTTQLILACLSGSFMGWGFIGLSTPRLLADPRLPAPEAVACDRLIKTAAANADQRPNIFVSLFPGLLLGAGTTALAHFKIITQKIASFSIFGAGFPIYLGPIYIGIGALVTFETAMMLFMGGVINSTVNAYAAANNLSSETFRWVGGAAMFVCVVYSLVNYILQERKKAKERANKTAQSTSEVREELLHLDATRKKMSLGGIAFGCMLFIVLLVTLGLSALQIFALSITGVVLGYLLSNLGGLLSLQVGSAASPVSGTVFVGLLVFSVIGLLTGMTAAEGALALVPPAVAILVSIVASNDASQDYKTVYLNGFKVPSSYSCQIIGLLGSSFVVPAVLAMMHTTQTLGSEALPIPQASFFAIVLKSIFIESNIPTGPVIAGAILGVLCVLMEVIARRRGLLLSSMALSVGIYLPVMIGMGALIGNLAKTIGARSLKADSHQGILITAGFICGDALFGLVISFLLLLGFGATGDFTTQPAWVSAIILAVVLIGIGYNYSQKLESDQS
jgi:putative OPT family oligopeptide transporter